MIVSVATEGAIAIVTVDNPPVNALGAQVRQELAQALTRTEADATVKAVVLICAGRSFFAGADIREFGKPPVPPQLPDLLDQIEAATKPWVAAIHGTALGGGLETAMVCRYRVAVPSARLGLPEVNLGLIPGAGGTVRLPRLVPATDAMEIMAGGKPITAQKALNIGLVDRVAEGDLRDAAITFATEIANAPLAPPTRLRPVRGAEDQQALETTADALKRKARGQIAPQHAIDALYRAIKDPVDDAFAAERAAFVSLRDGTQSAALRHIFFAERGTARDPRLKTTPPPVLNHIGVVGGGTMGSGIAVAAVQAGCRVTMIERDQEAADRGATLVAKTLSATRDRGLISTEQFDACLARFSATTAYSALSEADLLIEAVFEDIAVKQEVFAALDDVCSPDTILASNTSYLDVGALAAGTRHPERVIGLHFFSPAHIMKLLEIVVPDGVSDRALITAHTLAKRLKKIPVLAGVCDGFIANRIMSAYRREAEYMLEDGAMPWDVDRAMRDFGFAMGIFQVQDLAGLDISWAMRKRQSATRDPAQRYVDIGDRLCEAGHFGRKSGRGYYRYDNGKTLPCDETKALILAESERKNITRQTLSDAQIMTRILTALQKEAQAVLDEGIALCADDIDVVMVNAFGFPRWTGGPMFMAQQAAK